MFFQYRIKCSLIIIFFFYKYNCEFKDNIFYREYEICLKIIFFSRICLYKLKKIFFPSLQICNREIKKQYLFYAHNAIAGEAIVAIISRDFLKISSFDFPDVSFIVCQRVDVTMIDTQYDR